MIPNTIGRLQRLKVLYLGGNCLTDIPAEVGQLARLQALVLAENQLQNILWLLCNK
ncbi:Leucine-rich repeat-containing protein [Daphnia magna]|uniref:Leucine-rich repeat-containing protein n=1 Tax=Daphnia magna TaxID=35525 RepID=A0A162DAR8_9CRUS|nr:Leucine-rich repeat-containing protein [Daphnia magna]